MINAILQILTRSDSNFFFLSRQCLTLRLYGMVMNKFVLWFLLISLVGKGFMNFLFEMIWINISFRGAFVRHSPSLSIEGEGKRKREWNYAIILQYHFIILNMETTSRMSYLLFMWSIEGFVCDTHRFRVVWIMGIDAIGIKWNKQSDGWWLRRGDRVGCKL